MTPNATNDDYRAVVDRLVAEGRQLSKPTQVQLLEQAVALADQHRDWPLAYAVRLELMNAALNCGKADTLLIAFTWCAAMTDREPERFDPSPILWWNRWAVIFATNFPTITAEQIQAALADMERRYQQAGPFPRSVSWVKWKVAYEMGDLDHAAAMYETMQRTPNDWLRPDPDTEANMCLKYWLVLEQYETVATQGPLFLQQYHGTFYTLQMYCATMIALLYLDRWDEALVYHQKAYPQMVQRPSVVMQASRHIIVLGVTGNLARAFALVERYLDYCLTSDPQDQFDFFCAVELLLKCAAHFGTMSVALRLPPTAPGYHPTGPYDTMALAEAFRTACLAHAEQFDARNGNSYYTNTHARWQKLVCRARLFPLPSN